MKEGAELERALGALIAAGRVEVRENGQRLTSLENLQFEVREQGPQLLLHLWSDERTLVRRVLRVAEQSPERVVVEVRRFGRSKPATLELRSAESERSPGRLTREKFSERFRQLLSEQFPDEQIDSLTTAADLEHSFSRCYTRGVVRRGSRAWAVLGVSAKEDSATIDSILSYGLVWLHWTRGHARGRSVAGLRLFLPGSTSRVTAHRMSALDPATRIELYELDDTLARARPVDPRDLGNLATWLTPRREFEQTLAEAQQAINKIGRLAPECITATVPPGTRDVAFRFRGAEFARWHAGSLRFGLADDRRELTERTFSKLKELVRALETHRSPHVSDTAHPLYRQQAERWLESLVQADPTRIDPRLDPDRLYSQVPAFAAGDRGVIDLLGVTREGRLVVLELKADEDIHLVLQAVDYWLRVGWHHRQEDFQRYGYFPGIKLQPQPPLLYLIAPAIRFHPANEIVLRYLARDVPVSRVGLNENWRQGLRVVFRQ